MLEVGAILEGKVTGLTAFGAFVSLPDGKSVEMPSISAKTSLENPREFLVIRTRSPISRFIFFFNKTTNFIVL